MSRFVGQARCWTTGYHAPILGKDVFAHREIRRALSRRLYKKQYRRDAGTDRARCTQFLVFGSALARTPAFLQAAAGRVQKVFVSNPVTTMRSDIARVMRIMIQEFFECADYQYS